MSCEEGWKDVRSALSELIISARRLGEYADSVGERLPDDPSLLLGGEINSWQRFAEDAERAANRHRQALAAYLEAASAHGR